MSITFTTPTKQTDTIQLKIRQKIAEVALLANDLPGVVIIHNIHDLSVVYMSPQGTERLGVSLDEIIEMGPDYHKAFFNAEESQEYVPQIINLLERNNNGESLSLFQQVKGRGQPNWTWYASTMKIFMWDEAGKPLLIITIAIPIDPKHHMTAKVSRLLEENNFLRKNYHRFSQLSRRERQILTLLALGKHSSEIAKELFIAVPTVETHRRNIRHKLKISSAYDFLQYARAFDLI